MEVASSWGWGSGQWKKWEDVGQRLTFSLHVNYNY